MTYLHKLARRLSMAGGRGLGLAAAALAACSQAETRDFLSPTPGQPSPVVTALIISPRAGTVFPGETIHFTAVGVNALGASVPVDVVWHATGGVITPDGKFTSTAIGRFQVAASVRTQLSLTDSVPVAVYRTLDDVLSITLSPEDAEIRSGEMLKLSAYSSLAGGSTVGSLPLAWSASGGSVDGNGWFTSPIEGDYQVSASAASGVSSSVVVKVRNPKRYLEQMDVAPNAASLEVGGTAQFVMTGVWNDGSNQQPQAEWSSTGGTIDASGLYTAGSTPGNFRVIARDKFGTLTDTAYVSIREPTIVSVELAPQSVTVAPRAAQQFNATAHLSDGSTRTVGVSWSSSGGAVNSGGLYTAPSTSGVFLVTGSVGGTSLVDTATVTVAATEATLVQLVLNPSAVSLPSGRSRQFGVTALYSDGSTRTPAVQWLATGGAVTPAGLYTAGPSTGTFRVIAVETSSGMADSSTVTVTAPVLEQLVLFPATASLVPGADLQFTLTGVWSDGSTTIPVVSFDVTGGTVSSSGLYTAGQSSGTFRVIVQHLSGLADTSLVTIAPPEPVLLAIRIAPGAVTLPLEGSQQFTASGAWSGGASGPVSVVWSASGGSVTADGSYRAPPIPGTFRVIARQQSGALSDTALVTVAETAPTLTSLTVLPASTILQPGGTRQFSVSATWSDGSTALPAVNWSASAGTVTSNGLYYAPTAPGSYQVTVQQAGGGMSASAAVTVEAPPALVALAVTPDTARPQVGATVQFAAVGTYSNGGTGTPGVVWSATGGSISQGGLYAAGATFGSFRVIGSVAGLADTSIVMIGSGTPILVGVQITPDSAGTGPGGVLQFTASGLWSDGSTGVVPVAWSATGGSINASGLYSAGSIAGLFQVIALNGALADTAWVSVSAPAPTIVAVELSPASVAMWSGGLQQFSALGRFSDGSTGAVAVQYTATGGLITAGGLYTAGGVGGTYQVVAVDSQSGKADTAAVTITLAPPPGQYLTIAAKDWATFADKSALAGLFGVEGGLNNCTTPNSSGGTVCDPHLPATAFYDLVTDPLFGKVVRYNGDPSLNTYLTTMPGRVAVHGVGLGPQTNVWVRQFIKFSPNYTTIGLTGGSGASSHKMMFLRYEGSSLRQSWIIEGPRGMTHEVGAENQYVVASGQLSWNNTRTMNQEYNTSGWPFPDGWPMFRSEVGPQGAPTGPGTGEWYEVVLHHKVTGVRGEHTLGWRRYTVNGAVNPQPWNFRASWDEYAAGSTWRRIIRYEMGVNRNRQWDEPMFIYWGPYEVVDGTKYPNPWGLPGG